MTLDLENSYFFDKLDTCIEHMSKNKKNNLSNQPMLFSFLKKAPRYFAIIANLLSLFFVKSIDSRKTRKT